jgi:hypothetical protein
VEAEFDPVHYRCRYCNDVIFSSYPGEYVSCDCGKTSVDQTAWYTRFIGELPIRDKDNEEP